jgi:predicted nucleic acid-binding protein
VERARSGEAILFVSNDVVAEMDSVPRRPELTRRYSHLTAQRVDAFVKDVRSFAVHIAAPPKIFALPRDSKDEPYIDLAVAADASYLVTWNDRHLTYLMRKDTPEGVEFCRKFPALTIVTPPVFVQATTPSAPPAP